MVGTWTVTALEGTDGKAVSIDDNATANGVDPETLKCTYTFAEDGTFSGEMSGVTVSGNYTFEHIIVGVICVIKLLFAYCHNEICTLKCVIAKDSSN